MTVWPYLMALAGVCLAVACIARDRALIGLSAVILAAYVLARAIKTGLPADLHLIAFAVLWLSVAVVDAIRRQVDTKTSLLAAVALCYLWAKMAASSWVYGSTPFVAADLLAIAVMLLILKGAGRAFVGRVGDLGYSLRRGAVDSGGGMAMQKAQKAGR